MLFPPGQSIPDYSSVMSLRCELSEDKLRGKTKKWVLHVGNCTLVSVMRHLFIDIISADSQHNQSMFPKRVPDTSFIWDSKTPKDMSGSVAISISRGSHLLPRDKWDLVH